VDKKKEFAQLPEEFFEQAPILWGPYLLKKGNFPSCFLNFREENSGQIIQTVQLVGERLAEYTFKGYRFKVKYLRIYESRVRGDIEGVSSPCGIELTQWVGFFDIKNRLIWR
jgi:hypothetical protein